MILWAIRNKHTGAYLREPETLKIHVFSSDFAAKNHIAYKRLNPEYFEVVEFRR